MLKNWRVWFKISGKEEKFRSDTFMAKTRMEAKQAFKECYRHEVYEIATVEEITEAE